MNQNPSWSTMLSFYKQIFESFRPCLTSSSERISKEPYSALRLFSNSTVWRLKPHLGAAGSPFMKSIHLEAVTSFLSRVSNGSNFLTGDVGGSMPPISADFDEPTRDGADFWAANFLTAFVTSAALAPSTRSISWPFKETVKLLYLAETKRKKRGWSNIEQ